MNPASNETAGSQLPTPEQQMPAAPEGAPMAGQAAPSMPLPPMTLPLPPATPQAAAPAAGVPATPPQTTPAPIIDDGDLIEKEWVHKAKQIVEANRDDPYKQSEELTIFKADYMKKRYDKNIKLSK